MTWGLPFLEEKHGSPRLLPKIKNKKHTLTQQRIVEFKLLVGFDSIFSFFVAIFFFLLSLCKNWSPKQA